MAAADQKHGHGTRITITDGVTTVTFEEVDVTPVGLSKADPVDQTGNDNTLYRSQCPNPLKRKDPASATVYYRKDTDLANVKLLIESDTTGDVTFDFSDGSSLVDQGWLQSFAPAGQSADGRPQANITVEFEGETADGTDEWTYSTS